MRKKTVHLKESGLNAFLLHHAEKAGLVTAMLLALLFVFFRAATDKADSTKNPTDLASKVSTARDHIGNLDQRVWNEEVLPQRQPPNDYPERVRKQQEPTAARFYSTPIPFDPPKMVPLTKRRDPELFPVVDIRVIPATVCLAYNPTDILTDPTKNDTDAQLEEKKKPRRKPRRRPRNTGGFEGDDEGLDMPDDMGPEGLDDGGAAGMMTQWVYDADKRRGYAARPYTPKSSDDVFIAPGDADVIGKERHMMAIVALAPYKRQYEEYKDVFGGAVSYDMRRDRPTFLSFMAQRVDVTNDPNREIKEEEWETVRNVGHYVNNEVPSWNGVARDIFTSADNFHRKIVMDCPPIMMRDLKPFMWHPELPLRGYATATDEQLSAAQDAQRKEEEDAIPGLALARKKEEDPSGIDGGAGDTAGAGGASDEGMDEGDMAGMQAGMEGGMMDDYGGGQNFLEEETPVDYKLVRFYDFDVQPGHTYRYRIQLIYEDPNNPNITKDRGDLLVHSAPEDHTLADDVKLRLQKLNDKTNVKFFRNSNWSEPTAPAYFPQPEVVLVSSTRQATRVRDGNNNEFTRGEPQGTIKVVAWDKTRAVHVPIDRTVMRGSVLNFDGNFRYPHPFTYTIKNIEKFNTVTNWFVADLDGGELLPGGTKENPVYSPGEFALIDEKGNLIIRSELDDVDEFYRFTLEPKEETTTSGAGEGTEENMEDLSGLPGEDIP